MEGAMATVTSERYRAYTPRPFTRQERDTVTILFGGLHWRAERIVQAVLEGEAGRIGVEAVNKNYVYLTAGACGACRFGQYHQSYELALRNSGLGAFRMFLMAQDQLDQTAVMGDGLDFNLPITLGCLWAIFCTDLVQDLEYQVRPYEVVPGSTDAV